MSRLRFRELPSPETCEPGRGQGGLAAGPVYPVRGVCTGSLVPQQGGGDTLLGQGPRGCQRVFPSVSFLVNTEHVCFAAPCGLEGAAGWAGGVGPLFAGSCSGLRFCLVGSVTRLVD